VLLLKRGNFLKGHITSYKGKYILGLIVFAASVLSGVMAAANLNSEILAQLTGFISGFAEVKKGDDITFSGVFRSCILSNFKYICTYYILSLTVYSSVACFALSGVKGFASAFTATFLIREYALAGTLYSVLSIFPSLVLGTPVHLFASVVCMNFAKERHKKGEVGMKSAMTLLPALAVIYCIMILSGLFDVFISPVVFKYVF
jgi:stage II sporulation protein M